MAQRTESQHVCTFKPYADDRDDDLCGEASDTNVWTISPAFDRTEPDYNRVRISVYGFLSTTVKPSEARAISRALNKAANAAEGR
jgi:hypothetical protein